MDSNLIPSAISFLRTEWAALAVLLRHHSPYHSALAAYGLVKDGAFAVTLEKDGVRYHAVFGRSGNWILRREVTIEHQDFFIGQVPQRIAAILNSGWRLPKRPAA